MKEQFAMKFMLRAATQEDYDGVCMLYAQGDAFQALYLAGYRDVALYDASWEEWGTDPKRQVEVEGDDVS